MRNREWKRKLNYECLCDERLNTESQTKRDLHIPHTLVRICKFIFIMKVELRNLHASHTLLRWGVNSYKLQVVKWTYIQLLQQACFHSLRVKIAFLSIRLEKVKRGGERTLQWQQWVWDWRLYTACFQLHVPSAPCLRGPPAELHLSTWMSSARGRNWKFRCQA